MIAKAVVPVSEISAYESKINKALVLGTFQSTYDALVYDSKRTTVSFGVSLSGVTNATFDDYAMRVGVSNTMQLRLENVTASDMTTGSSTTTITVQIMKTEKNATDAKIATFQASGAFSKAYFDLVKDTPITFDAVFEVKKNETLNMTLAKSIIAKDLGIDESKLTLTVKTAPTPSPSRKLLQASSVTVVVTVSTESYKSLDMKNKINLKQSTGSFNDEYYYSTTPTTVVKFTLALADTTCETFSESVMKTSVAALLNVSTAAMNITDPCFTTTTTTTTTTAAATNATNATTAAPSNATTLGGRRILADFSITVNIEVGTREAPSVVSKINAYKADGTFVDSYTYQVKPITQTSFALIFKGSNSTFNKTAAVSAASMALGIKEANITACWDCTVEVPTTTTTTTTTTIAPERRRLLAEESYVVYFTVDLDTKTADEKTKEISAVAATNTIQVMYDDIIVPKSMVTFSVTLEGASEFTFEKNALLSLVSSKLGVDIESITVTFAAPPPPWWVARRLQAVGITLTVVVKVPVAQAKEVETAASSMVETGELAQSYAAAVTSKVLTFNLPLPGVSKDQFNDAMLTKVVSEGLGVSTNAISWAYAPSTTSDVNLTLSIVVKADSADSITATFNSKASNGVFLASYNELVSMVTIRFDVALKGVTPSTFNEKALLRAIKALLSVEDDNIVLKVNTATGRRHLMQANGLIVSVAVKVLPASVSSTRTMVDEFLRIGTFFEEYLEQENKEEISFSVSLPGVTSSSFRQSSMIAAVSQILKLESGWVRVKTVIPYANNVMVPITVTVEAGDLAAFQHIIDVAVTHRTIVTEYFDPTPSTMPTTKAPPPTTTTEAPAAETTTEAPAAETTTEAPAAETTTEAPAPATTTEAPAPATTTEAPAPATTTEAPAPATTAAAPVPAPTTTEAPKTPPKSESPSPSPPSSSAWSNSATLIMATVVLAFNA